MDCRYCVSIPVTLQLVSRKPDTQRSFADVRDGLIDKLRHDYIDQESTDHVSKVRGGTLEADADLVASIRTRFLPAGAKTLPSEAATGANQAALKRSEELEKAAKQAPDSH